MPRSLKRMDYRWRIAIPAWSGCDYVVMVKKSPDESAIFTAFGRYDEAPFLNPFGNKNSGKFNFHCSCPLKEAKESFKIHISLGISEGKSSTISNAT